MWQSSSINQVLMFHILQSAACLHTHKHTSMHNEKWVSRGCVWPVSILAWRVLARSEYESFAKVINFYKIYTYFDLGADRQISLRWPPEKLGRKNTTPHPTPRSFINFSQCKKKGINYLPLQTRPVIEGGGRKREKERGLVLQGVNWYH